MLWTFVSDRAVRSLFAPDREVSEYLPPSVSIACLGRANQAGNWQAGCLCPKGGLYAKAIRNDRYACHDNSPARPADWPLCRSCVVKAHAPQRCSVVMGTMPSTTGMGGGGRSGGGGPRAVARLRAWAVARRRDGRWRAARDGRWRAARDGRWDASHGRRDIYGRDASRGRWDVPARGEGAGTGGKASPGRKSGIIREVDKLSASSRFAAFATRNKILSLASLSLSRRP